VLRIVRLSIAALLVMGIAVIARGGGVGRTPMVPARAGTLVVPSGTPLDHGAVALPHVLVTALGFASDGTIYGGGRYAVPNPHQLSPVAATGSVWLVSHDHGVTWSERISTTSATVLRQAERLGPPAWHDHTRWPLDFTATRIVVSPHNQRLIYVAGCSGWTEIPMQGQQIDGGALGCTGGKGTHILLRSANGGQTWQDALWLWPTVAGDFAFGRKTPSMLTTNIAPTAALLAALAEPNVWPQQTWDVVVDPHHENDVTASVANLGLVHSSDGDRTWRYASQPAGRSAHNFDALLIDPRDSRIIYDASRIGVVMRSVDGGRSWATQSNWAGSDLAIVGDALYMTSSGAGVMEYTSPVALYASTDGGVHWRLSRVPPYPKEGVIVDAIRGSNGWLAVYVDNAMPTREGIYAAHDGTAWRIIIQNRRAGSDWYSGKIDVMWWPRVWDDTHAHIVFAAKPTGGLHRWRSNL